MKIINKKDNTLIKKNKLILFLRENGINRIKPSALRLIEEIIKSNISNILIIAKENMNINGRKTILDEDIKSFETESKKESFEI